VFLSLFQQGKDLKGEEATARLLNLFMFLSLFQQGKDLKNRVEVSVGWKLRIDGFYPFFSRAKT